MKIISIEPNDLYETGPIIVNVEDLRYTDVNLLINGVESDIKVVNSSVIKATIPQIPRSRTYDLRIQVRDRSGKIIFSQSEFIFINSINKEDLPFRFPPIIDPNESNLQPPDESTQSSSSSESASFSSSSSFSSTSSRSSSSSSTSNSSVSDDSSSSDSSNSSTSDSSTSDSLSSDSSPSSISISSSSSSDSTDVSSSSSGEASAESGAMMAFLDSTAPSGWLLCDGSAVSRTTYSDLFAVIGTAYGAGDGSTTFNLPDGRGRSIFGDDGATFVTGGNGGSTTHDHGGSSNGHALAISEMPSHDHNGPWNGTVPAADAAHTCAVGRRSTGNRGSSDSHSHSLDMVNILPPYQTCYWIIAE